MTRRDWFRRLVGVIAGAFVARSVPKTTVPALTNVAEAQAIADRLLVGSISFRPSAGAWPFSIGSDVRIDYNGEMFAGRVSQIDADGTVHCEDYNTPEPDPMPNWQEFYRSS